MSLQVGMRKTVPGSHKILEYHHLKHHLKWHQVIQKNIGNNFKYI